MTVSPHNARMTTIPRVIIVLSSPIGMPFSCNALSVVATRALCRALLLQIQRAEDDRRIAAVSWRCVGGPRRGERASLCGIRQRRAFEQDRLRRGICIKRNFHRHLARAQAPEAHERRLLALQLSDAQ